MLPLRGHTALYFERTIQLFLGTENTENIAGIGDSPKDAENSYEKAFKSFFFRYDYDFCVVSQ
jgi:hypothetical protein